MRPTLVLASLVFTACSAAADPVLTEDPLPPAATAQATAVAEVDYPAARAALEARRVELAAAWGAASTEAERAAVIEEARTALIGSIQDEFFVAWAGTDWDFYGTSTQPNSGKIACGHYVSVVLDHAGLEVDRLKLGQQASENIIKTFSKRSDIRRFSDRPAKEVVQAVRDWGPGLYILGLDYHAAFLTTDGTTVEMCHSSYLGEAKVLCEDAESSPAMVSHYRVVGKLFDDAMMTRWLRGQPFATVGSAGP